MTYDSKVVELLSQLPGRHPHFEAARFITDPDSFYRVTPEGKVEPLRPDWLGPEPTITRVSDVPPELMPAYEIALTEELLEVHWLSTPDAAVFLTQKGRAALSKPGTDDGVPPDGPKPDDWILVSKAVARLAFICNLKALYKFAKDNPDKLRLRPHPTHKKRQQANAADVLRLEMEHDEKQFEALGDPTADDLPSVSGEGLEVLAKRIAAERASKRK